MFDLFFGFDTVVSVKSQHIEGCHHSIVLDMVKQSSSLYGGMDM